MKIQLTESVLRDIVRSEILRRKQSSLQESSHWGNTVEEMQTVLNGTHTSRAHDSAITTSLATTGVWDTATQDAWEKFLKHYLRAEDFIRIGSTGGQRIGWGVVSPDNPAPADGYDPAHDVIQFTHSGKGHGRPLGALNFVKALISDGPQEGSPGGTSAVTGEEERPGSEASARDDGDGELTREEEETEETEPEETEPEETESEETEGREEGGEVGGGPEIMGHEDPNVEYREITVVDKAGRDAFIVRVSAQNYGIIGRKTGHIRDIFGPQMVTNFERELHGSEENSFIIRWGEYEGMPESGTLSMVGNVEFKITELKGVNFFEDLGIKSVRMRGTPHRKMFDHLKAKEREEGLEGEALEAFNFLKEAEYEVLAIRTDRGRFKRARFEPWNRVEEGNGIALRPEDMRMIDDNFWEWTQEYGQNLEVNESLDALYDIIVEVIASHDSVAAEPIPLPYDYVAEAEPRPGGMSALLAIGIGGVLLDDPTKSYVYPVPKSSYSTYPPRSSPPGTDRGTHMHSGDDIPVVAGTPVVAFAGGFVTKVDRTGAGTSGCMVSVRHSDDPLISKTAYMHLTTIVVEEGEELTKGSAIGKSGGVPDTPCAGRTDGAHLHFSIVKSGEAGYSEVPGFYDNLYTMASEWTAGTTPDEDDDDKPTDIEEFELSYDEEPCDPEVDEDCEEEEEDPWKEEGFPELETD